MGNRQKTYKISKQKYNKIMDKKISYNKNQENPVFNEYVIDS